MNPKYTRASLIGGISGLILQTGCYALVKVFAERARAHQAVPPEWVGYALVVGMVLGSILLILALCDFAKAKGYSGFVGLLLGLCSCLGLLVLVLLPDRTKS
jgi:uncharacterized YccA/Bax inhibitor family protein